MVIMGIAMAVLSLLTLVSLLALVDHHRTLELLRQRLTAEASPRAIRYTNPAGGLAAMGLPARLADLEHLVLLFLSTTCVACRQLAEPLAMEPAPPERLWIIVDAPTAVVGDRWLSETGLPPDNVMIDSDHRMFSGFGVGVTPALLVLKKGEVLLGQSVSTYEHLKLMLSESSLPPSSVETKEGAEV